MVANFVHLAHETDRIVVKSHFCEIVGNGYFFIFVETFNDRAYL